ncbi:hypothetical protein DPMN_086427 [Dreissena polymorpha]|uniref:Uncharacterized protein n=1 Tax=Dreissena polymorpha TaxID=45954 RepID=A0A9D4QVG4_DREPO|nr:hypothetical protein DPMN_086427 [Dreissena polymorpha]
MKSAGCHSDKLPYCSHGAKRYHVTRKLEGTWYILHQGAICGSYVIFDANETPLEKSHTTMGLNLAVQIPRKFLIRVALKVSS